MAIKKQTGFLLFLLTLASCSNPKPSSSLPISSSLPSSLTPSSEEKKPPVFSEDDFSYLLGTYYSKGETLTLSKERLLLEGDNRLSLVPTSIDTLSLSYKNGEESVSYDTIVVSFGKEFNDGSSYKAYVNFSDGLLHLEKEGNDGGFSLRNTFRPSIEEYSGVYSGYGDGSTYNVYVSFDGHFDLERGVFPSNHHSGIVFAGEQDWYLLSSFVNLNGKIYKALEEYDVDDYGYGKGLLVRNDKGTFWLNNIVSDDTSSHTYVYDIGGFSGLSLFDGEKNIQTSLDLEKKIFFFGETSGSYEAIVDDKGLALKTVLDGKTYVRRRGEYYLDLTIDGKGVTYPLNTIGQLYGKYAIDDSVFEIVKVTDESTGNEKEPIVKRNGKEIKDFSYVIENKRKSIFFSEGGKKYILSPDKADSSIRLNLDGKVSYPINEDKYKGYYLDSFFYHDYTSLFSLNVLEGLSYQMNGKEGKAKLSYTHGQKFPSLSFVGEGKNYSLQIKDVNSGYYLLSDGEKTYDRFSKTVLDKVYGDYSSNYTDSLTFTAEKVTKDGADYAYAFTPILDANTGYYTFGITTKESKDNIYTNNLVGTFFSQTKSYVKKEIFSTLVGTYSAYGKYGIENIKFTKDGKLKLDRANSSNDGLDRDVEKSYTIWTDGNAKAVLAFQYKEDVSPFIYFRDGYAEIRSLKYYDENILSAWGTYSQGDNTLYFQNEDLYLNGTKLTTTKRQIKDGKLLYTTSDATYTFDSQKGTVERDEDGNKTERQRVLTYSDFAKFEGTYTINDKSVVFAFDGIISYSAKIDGAMVSSYYITKYEGKYALAFSDLNGTYYLRLDTATNKVTTAFVQASLPPVPPPPPAP